MKWGRGGPAIVLTPQDMLISPNMASEGRASKSSQAKIVTVANEILRRKKELGYPLLKKLMEKNQITIIGKNEGISDARVPRDHSEFKKFFCSGEIYLYTVEQPFGDGYNTAMLEAMSLGMPVVTVANPSSPIKHGYNGLVGRDAEELNSHLAAIKNNPAEVKRLGQNAKKTVEKDFSRHRFVNQWKNLIEKSCQTGGDSRVAS